MASSAARALVRRFGLEGKRGVVMHRPTNENASEVHARSSGPRQYGRWPRKAVTAQSGPEAWQANGLLLAYAVQPASIAGTALAVVVFRDPGGLSLAIVAVGLAVA